VRIEPAGWTGFLIRRSRPLLLSVLVASAWMAWLASGLEVERGLDALTDRDSAGYAAYSQFIDSFGGDDLIVAVINDRRGALNPRVLDALEGLTAEMESIEGISEVISLGNLRLPSGTGGPARMTALHDIDSLKKARSEWPFVRLLVSDDLESLGLVTRMTAGDAGAESGSEILSAIRSAVRRHFPQAEEFHLTGSPVLMDAFYRYNVSTTFIFGGLASIVGAALLTLIFRSMWMPLIVYPISGLAALWGAGLLAAAGARLNILSGLCIGFVFVVTTANVVHLVAAYETAPEGRKRVADALRSVGRPCLMCALTTSAGFASIMVSRLQAVRQFGMVMSLATLLSFVLALVLAPVFLPLLDHRRRRVAKDRYAAAVAAAGRFAFRHPAACIVAGTILALAALAGIPLIELDILMFSMFRERTPEVRALRYIEQRLAPVNGLEIMVSGHEGTFLEESAWSSVRAFESRLEGVTEISAVDSILPVLESRLAALAPTFEQDFPGEPALARILTGLTMHADGRRLVRSYVTEGFDRLRLSARVRGEDQRQLDLLMQRIDEIAQKELGSLGDVAVTGSLSFFGTQFRDLIRAQILSLLIALSVIVLLMIVQFRSVALGMLSLVPNIFPALIVLGLMGWAGIPFSGMTVLVAAIALGLSADDTIHYLTHFREELKGDVAEALGRAYRRTGKALFSTTLVLAASLGVLIFAPLRPSLFFGILISVAIVGAWAADVMLMPSILLASGRIRRMFEPRIEV
jgi:predicted RND superfamily exporter protein